MLGNTNVNHVSAFNVKDGANGADQATKAVFLNSIADRPYDIEANMLRNSEILGSSATHSLNKSVGFNQTTHNNPAGSYRVGYMPRVLDVEEWTPTKRLGTTTYEAAYMENVELQINQPHMSKHKTISPVDGQWLFTRIQESVTQVILNSMVQYINYTVHGLFPTAAVNYVDATKGKSPYVAQNTANLSNEEYTELIIDQTATYKARPEDRLVAGIKDNEKIIVIDPTIGVPKLLKDRLRIFDGQFAGTANEFYTGLPAMKEFADTPIMESLFINKPFQSTGKLSHYITTVGRYGALLFDMPIFEAHAEIIAGSGKELDTYATMVYGASIPKTLSQFVTVAYEGAAPVAFADANHKMFFASNENAASGEIFLNWKDIVGTNVTGVLYKVVPVEDENSTVDWVSVASTEDVTGLSVTTNSNGALEDKTTYRVLWALTENGTSPLVDATSQETYEVFQYTSTK